MKDKYTTADLKDWLRELGRMLDKDLSDEQLTRFQRMQHQTWNALDTLEDIEHKLNWMNKHERLEKD